MSLIWGMIHLVSTLDFSTVGVQRTDWAFGQVIPVVLLAAPVIAIVEFFCEGEVNPLVDYFQD
jgi:hypothetical protein